MCTLHGFTFISFFFFCHIHACNACTYALVPFFSVYLSHTSRYHSQRKRREEQERIIWARPFFFCICQSERERERRRRTSPLRLSFCRPEWPTTSTLYFAPLLLPHAFVSLTIFIVMVFVSLSFMVLGTLLVWILTLSEEKKMNQKPKVLKIVLAEKDAGPKRDRLLSNLFFFFFFFFFFKKKRKKKKPPRG